MKFGINAIINSKKSDQSLPLYGMPEAHIRAMLESSNELKMPILIRPVNPLSTYYLANGYPTKNFFVKNKSSKMTVTAGLIPIDARFSHIPESEIIAHDNHIQKALQQGYTKTHLILPEKRFEELEKLGLFEKKETESGTFLITWKKDNATREAIAKKNSGGHYEIFDKEKNPIEVLAKKINGKEQPVCADYDIFAALIDFKVFSPGGKDKSPLRTQGFIDNLEEIIHEIQRPSYVGPKENVEVGNVSTRMLSVIESINKNVAKIDSLRETKELATVHHNAEMQNPFASAIGSNIPILMVLPTKINLDELSDHKKVDVVLIETVEEAVKIYEKMAEKGYYWAQHAKIPEFRRINLLQKKIQSSLPVEAGLTGISSQITESIHQAREKKQKEKDLKKDHTKNDLKKAEEEKEKKRLIPRTAVFARSEPASLNQTSTTSSLDSSHADSHLPIQQRPPSIFIQPSQIELAEYDRLGLMPRILSLIAAFGERKYTERTKNDYLKFVNKVSELKSALPPEEWEKLNELIQNLHPILDGYHEKIRRRRR